MDNKNVFDTVMDYIDENICQGTEEMNRGIYGVSHYSDADFNKFISVLTSGEMTLQTYIRKRKLYFATLELVSENTKSITDIAMKYYENPTSFNRALKAEYGKTPSQIRKEKFSAPNNRIYFSEFCETNKSRLDEVLNELTHTGDIHYMSDYRYFEDFIHATEEYGFSTSTCCAISTVAENLGIPFGHLLNECFEMMIDIHSDPDYIDPEIEAAIDCGIKSEEEMRAICKYYGCRYYQINRIMVEEYRKHNK